MGWQASTLTILSLKAGGSSGSSAVQSNKVTAFTDFEATGRGFPIDGASLLLVHAHDTTNNFKPWHVIPCEQVEVATIDPQEGLQRIRFKASLQERRSGSYHLVAWAPTRRQAQNILVNEATTFENAFTLEEAPNLDQALKEENLQTEPA